jgi:class 3 adenylate cyclase
VLASVRSAGGSEILVSQTVRDLTAGIQFGDMGARELKGVRGSWRLSRVANQPGV